VTSTSHDLAPGAPGLVTPRRAPLRYQGFVSYSHVADAGLAPVLVRGLQRFAKPWYRTRALRIFRDDAELSVNPDLWQSVEEALAASEHLILLASPRAAASEWVARETAYWVEHKSLDTILIVLTDGEIAFGADGTTVVAAADDALPAPLRDAFPSEPRYLDLRWARQAQELSLRDPRMRDAVADLAAPLHGRPKDELAGEDVRQHRRMLRTVRAAIAVLVTLLVAAVVAALVAYTQYRSAQARALAAQATADLAGDPEHSVALALRSTRIEAGATAVQALRSALAQAPLRMTIDSGAGAGAHAAWNPAADQIAVSGAGDSVALWDPRTGRVERVLRGPPEAAVADPLYSNTGPLLYSPDGRWIAYESPGGHVSVWNALTGVAASTAGLSTAVTAAASRTIRGRLQFTWSTASDTLLVYGSALAEILGYAPVTGVATRVIGLPTGADDVVPSPDGARLFVDFAGGDAVADLGSGRLRPLVPATPFAGHDACWLPGGAQFITWDPTEAEDGAIRRFNAATGRQVGATAVTSTVSAAVCGGTRAAPWIGTGDNGGGVQLRIDGQADVLSGQGEIVGAAAASPNGASFATGSDDGTVRVWEVQTAQLIRVLPDGSPLRTVAFSPDSGLVLTTDARGLVRIWDAGVGEPATTLQEGAAGASYPLGFARHGTLVDGLHVSIGAGGRTIASAALDVWSSATGRLVSSTPLPAGATAGTVGCTTTLSATELCPLTPPPSLVTSIPTPTSTAIGGVPPIPVAVAVNADGTEIAVARPHGVTVLDTAGRTLATVALPQVPTGIAFASGSDTLLAMTNAALYIWGADLGLPPVRIAQASPPRDAELSADGGRVAVAQTGGTVGVWDAATGRLVMDARPSAADPPYLAGRSAPIPVRVAISPDGRIVAAGTTWETVSLWDVDSGRRFAVDLVSTPADAELGDDGGNASWAIAELSFAAGGTRLLAADYPQIGNGDSEPPGAATVIGARSGAVVARYASPGSLGAAVNPGAGLNPNGTGLLTGVLGFATAPPGGLESVLQVSTGDTAVSLQNAGPPAGGMWDSPVPADPWSLDGVSVLAGTRGIYRCDACGGLAELQAAAARQLAWQAPLSVAHDVPPAGNPYG
jgi:WD40 repeat protein